MPAVASKGKPTMLYMGEGKVWVTPSKSRPDHKHVTVYNPENNFQSCTCEGFIYRHKCWHIDEIREDNVDEDFEVSL